MQFGTILATHISKWELARYAEELGYDRAWFPDSQMIWSDCYATLALAAANTKRIHIGTGVSIAPTRIAPVTAHSIASINQIAAKPARLHSCIAIVTSSTSTTAFRSTSQPTGPRLAPLREPTVTAGPPSVGPLAISV